MTARGGGRLMSESSIPLVEVSTIPFVFYYVVERSEPQGTPNLLSNFESVRTF